MTLTGGLNSRHMSLYVECSITEPSRDTVKLLLEGCGSSFVMLISLPIEFMFTRTQAVDLGREIFFES